MMTSVRIPATAAPINVPTHREVLFAPVMMAMNLTRMGRDATLQVCELMYMHTLTVHTTSSIRMREMLLHHNVIMKHYQNISESPCFHVYVRTSETGTFNVTSRNGNIQCVLPVLGHSMFTSCNRVIQSVLPVTGTLNVTSLMGTLNDVLMFFLCWINVVFISCRCCIQ